MMSGYWQEFFQLALIHFLAVIVPGPDFAITIRQSIIYGRLHGMVTAVGIGAGLSVHVAYTLLGVSALIMASSDLMMIAKVFGIGYLSFLGINMCLSRKVESSGLLILDDTKSVYRSQSLRQAFLIGFLTNATNPKATLFFLAIITTVVSVNTPLNIQVYYGVWMCFVNAAWFVLISLLFSNNVTKEWFNRHTVVIERFLGAVFIAFAARLAFS